HTRFSRDWSSDVCSSDLKQIEQAADEALRTEPPPQNKTMGGIPRNALLKPSDAQWRQGSQKFVLGDRVIYTADSGKVPIASKGKIGRASCRERDESEDGR